MLLDIIVTIAVFAFAFEGYWVSALLLTYPSDLAVFVGIVGMVLTGWITVYLLYLTWRKRCAELFSRFSS